MKLTQEQADLINAGRKSQHRIPAKGSRCPYREGRTYAMVVEGQTFGRLTVAAVRREPVSEITDNDLRREGFKFRAQYVAAWNGYEGDVWVLTVIRGDLTDTPRLLRAGAPKAASCPSCGRGFADRDHMGVPVTRCVCGARRPAETESDHGYTPSAALGMRDAGEAVSRQVQEEQSKAARAKPRVESQAILEEELREITARLAGRIRDLPLDRDVRRDLSRMRRLAQRIEERASLAV